LKRDGVSREVPSLEVVDYFSRAFGSADDDEAGRRRLDAPRGVLEELRSAVFEEGRSLGELRKRFDPVLRPKSVEVEQGDSARRLKAQAERFAQSLESTEGLSEKRVARTLAAIEALVRDLDALIEQQKPAGKGKETAAARAAGRSAN
jgi:hypothetical protein